MYLSKDKLIEIFNLSWMKLEKVGLIGHGISTGLLLDYRPGHAQTNLLSFRD